MKELNSKELLNISGGDDLPDTKVNWWGIIGCVGGLVVGTAVGGIGGGIIGGIIMCN
jgi:hypothetical protein